MFALFYLMRAWGSYSLFVLGYAADASKTGVAQETLQNTVRRAGKVITEQEARQILGVTEETTWEEVLKVSVAFLRLFRSFLSYDNERL